jgi:probable F420-dependent oxidoreductase
MEFGVTMFPTDYSMQPADLAVAVEERGFDALFFPDHTHIPASRISPFRTGGDLPSDYYHNADMFLSLAAAAAVTKKIRLGTGVCLVIERDPIVLAKEVASLDHISGGRVDFGVGAGWNAEEMANHGIDFGRRWKVLRERIEAMKAIWTQDEASYQGEFVNFEKIWSWPKPVQKPHPPIFVGGDGKGTFKRVLRYGDGWIPMLDNGEVSMEYITEKLTRLREMSAEEGRPAPLITTFAAPRDPGYIAQLRELGVNRCMFGLKAAPAEEVLPRLDKLLATLRQVA